ncbi:hypothetical protein EMIT0162MI3_12510 [Pseudomonas chlororaphis]
MFDHGAPGAQAAVLLARGLPPALAISPALTNLSCTYRSSKGLRR